MIIETDSSAPRAMPTATKQIWHVGSTFAVQGNVILPPTTESSEEMTRRVWLRAEKLAGAHPRLRLSSVLKLIRSGFASGPSVRIDF